MVIFSVAMVLPSVEVMSNGPTLDPAASGWGCTRGAGDGWKAIVVWPKAELFTVVRSTRWAPSACFSSVVSVDDEPFCDCDELRLCCELPCGASNTTSSPGGGDPTLEVPVTAKW